MRYKHWQNIMESPTKQLKRLMKVRKLLKRYDLPLTVKMLQVDIALNQQVGELWEVYFDWQAKQIADLKIKL